MRRSHGRRRPIGIEWANAKAAEYRFLSEQSVAARSVEPVALMPRAPASRRAKEHPVDPGYHRFFSCRRLSPDEIGVKRRRRRRQGQARPAAPPAGLWNVEISADLLRGDCAGFAAADQQPRSSSTRRVQGDGAALKEDQPPPTFPIEASAGSRAYASPWHLGQPGAASMSVTMKATYELFCLAQELKTHFLVRFVDGLRMAVDTIATEMEETGVY